MPLRGLKIGFLLACLGTIGLVIVRQRQTTAELQWEVSRAREQTREAADHRAQAERDDAIRRRAATDEGDKLRRDQAEAEELRREISELRRSLSSPSPTSAPRASAAELVPKQWTNAGRSTPAATFESILWSAAQGDTDALAAMIVFDPAGRELVDGLFARLSAAGHGASDTSEKVFATLLAARLPQDLSSATVTQATLGSTEATLRMHLQHVTGAEKDANFSFRQSADGWRLIVPTSVVENYQKMLANAPTAASR